VDATEILAHLAELGTPPDADSAFEISVGLENTIHRLKNETFPFLAAGGSELQFVFGPYGRGKSHFLRTVEDVARDHRLVTAYVDCRAGQSPFREIRETYRMIASAMSVENTEEGLSPACGITKLIEESIHDLRVEEAREKLEDIRSDNQLVADFRNLVYAFGMTVLRGEASRGLGEDLNAILTDSPTYRVSVGALYREHKELPRPLGKLGRRNSGQWLRSLLSLPRALGYQGFVILFDETEKTHSFHRLGSKKQQKHLANLRNFVDYMAVGAFNGCAIYYAVVEDFIVLAREQLEALSQRIERLRIPDVDYRNPRAVWVSLDELTEPSTDSPAFYEKLAENIVSVGKKAGLTDQKASELIRSLKQSAQEYTDTLYEGAVREFVKKVAGTVVMEVK
jgi:BREX system ATP-binding protein BrxC/D